MKRFRNGLVPVAVTLLRISTGVIMVMHGLDKIHDIPAWTNQLTSLGVPSPQIMAYLAIAGEFGGGLGLLVGLLTPIAALGIMSNMAVAIFKVHWHNGLAAKNNGFEYPLTLFMIGFFFFCYGAGPVSLDRLFCRGKSATPL